MHSYRDQPIKASDLAHFVWFAETKNAFKLILHKILTINP